MALNAPGKHYREGIRIVEVVRRFSTEKKAYQPMGEKDFQNVG